MPLKWGQMGVICPCPGSSVVAKMDFVVRRDFKLNLDTETIQSYLHESVEYHNDWESEN
jgi:hypothetical protein